ncbi:TetR/AcrR family transcriptional regulator [Nocardia mangyaensis]|uniref:TetR/AcrR family transcriptional regulator n=1 Tax=Nocardia mangyaensis TaxID=2213200 RepID=UPI00267501B1|nr:TetR/AcrR family transcriptional regulator [Nocardia mangyaensis]MDO3646461.1 TetR/AcrR family transcriptional regulator [Nocardia mangyaensis]
MSSATSRPSSAVSGRQARWQPHNDSRRERIVLSAIELLEQSPAGVEVPIVQIAEHAGLAKSVVYRQFAGRDELDRRIRSEIADRFVADIEDALDIGEGSIHEILVRTVGGVVTWIQEHPRLHDFLRTGPSEAGSDVDAMSELIGTIAASTRALVTGLAGVVGVADDGSADAMTFAIVSMTEATVTRWANDPNPVLTRDQLIEEVASYAWHVVDGVARRHGLTLDPEQQLTSVITQLATGGG